MGFLQQALPGRKTLHVKFAGAKKYLVRPFAASIFVFNKENFFYYPAIAVITLIFYSRQSTSQSFPCF